MVNEAARASPHAGDERRPPPRRTPETSVAQLRHEDVLELGHVHELYERAPSVAADWARRTAAAGRLLSACCSSPSFNAAGDGEQAPLLRNVCLATADGHLWGSGGDIDLPGPPQATADLYLNVWLSGIESRERWAWQLAPRREPRSLTLAHHDAQTGRTERLPLPLRLSSQADTQRWHERMRVRCLELHGALDDEPSVRRLGAEPESELAELSRGLRRAIRQPSDIPLEAALPDLHALGDEVVVWIRRARRRAQGARRDTRHRPEPPLGEPHFAPLTLGEPLDTLDRLLAWEAALARALEELWMLATGAGEQRLPGQLVANQGDETVWCYRAPDELQGPVSLRVEVDTQGVPRDLSWRLAQDAELGVDHYPATTEYQPCDSGGYELCLARSMSWPPGSRLFLTLTAGLEPRVFCRVRPSREEPSP